MTALLALGGLLGSIALARAARRAGVRGRLGGAAGRVVLPGRLRGEVGRRLARAGIDLEPEPACGIWCGAVAVAAWSAVVLAPPLAVPASLAAVAAGPAVLRWRAAAADQAARAALAPALDHVVAVLRAGGTIPDAVEVLAGRPGPVAADFRRIRSRLALGAGLDRALLAWSEERPVPEVRVAAGALAVTVRVGGSAATPLEGLAASLRDERTARGEARALSTQARLSAMVVGVAPLGFLAFAALADPRSTAVLVSTPLGGACLVAGLALEGLGAWWMHHLLGTGT